MCVSTVGSNPTIRANLSGSTRVLNSDLRIAHPREKRIVYTLVIEVVDAYAIVQKRSLQSAGHFGERGGWKLKVVAGRG